MNHDDTVGALTNLVEQWRETDRIEYSEYLTLHGLIDGLWITKDTSDGHHTFEELYDYRMLYNAHAVHGWLARGIPVMKSWNHHDGEPCFGGGMFVVQAELPTGQVSNHYKAEYWDLFHVQEFPKAPEYDGHTPEQAAERMRLMLQLKL